MQGLTSPEQAVVEGARGTASLERVERWANVSSGTGNLAGLATMAGLLADALTALPGEITLVDPTPVEQVGGDGVVRPVEHGRHLHLTVRPDAPVRMLFTGHMDTVYPADHPFRRCATNADGTINGPGVADMKGGLEVMIAALGAIEASEAARHLGYEIVVNSDEETGSLGSAALIARAARGKVAGLTFEPALADGTLAGARGGTGNFAIVVRGRSAHAGRNPADGRNAIVAAADLTLRIADVAGPGLSVNPARIDGGGPNNVVPDIAVLRINLRPDTADAIVLAQAGIDAAATAVAAGHDVSVTVHGGFNRPPKPMTDAAERLFGRVRSAGAALAIPVAWRATGGVCDGNLIAAAGVPVVDTMGVRGGALHSPQEYMVPESLAERAGLAALTILRIAADGRP